MVSDGGVTLRELREPVRLPAIPERAAEPVHLVTFVSGMDGGVIRLLGSQRPAGFVLAAAGSGNTHPDFQAAALEQKAAGLPIVLTSRCAFGSVGAIYAFPGGGATWARADVLLSSLPALKARVGLALALGTGASEDEVRAVVRA
jgi:L-asparaginase